ncbi:methyl-accepting chemotaxis protein [Dactylosporangium sp. CA-092794]|uniref:methyl-accepting chemotaxis protein n=1 Tax=Dactylosporangium sp. CA-092794 TaxID=3239929 RepID=UPI003D929852
MARQWTFGRRLGLGFTITAALTVLTGALTVWALSTVSAAKDRVIDVGVRGLAAAQELRVAVEAKSSAGRAYLLTGDQRYVQQVAAARQQFAAAVDRVRGVLDDPAERDLLDQAVTGEQRHQDALQAVFAQRDRPGAEVTAISAAFESGVAPLRDALDRQITALTARLDAEVRSGQRSASTRANVTIAVVIAIKLASVVFGTITGISLSRALARQVAGTVGHIRSSSAQLEASAGQQATGAREQATAMSEITTTIEELLITSRQIADGAQRVAKVAEETASAAGSGDSTIEEARASIAAIRRQVDLIVQHMLELGQRSQQIGGVVDLVSELAEQTNILAINATIEASGAGEWGRRFAVVADEIRKLADRTAGSAKEIRALIEDVRGAVNTTVMATETGAKAVDAGTRQFTAVTAAFQQIADLVATTTESAREIELSTKQQTTAVEQVNVAVTDTARVTQESESSAVQTRQTAAHLTGLSTSLLRLVTADNGT